MTVGVPIMRGRMFELASSTLMFSWGVAMLPASTAITPSSAYWDFVQKGYSEEMLGPLFTIIGGSWIIVLFVNGMWHRSPIIRAIGSGVAVMVWYQVAFLLWQKWWYSDIYSVTPFGWVTYFVFGSFNVWSFFASIRDATVARKLFLRGK